MGTRIIAGLSGLAIVVPVIVYGGAWSVWWLMLPFVLIALDEYVRMAAPELSLLGKSAYLAGGLGTVTVGARP